MCVLYSCSVDLSLSIPWGNSDSNENSLAAILQNAGRSLTSKEEPEAPAAPTADIFSLGAWLSTPFAVSSQLPNANIAPELGGSSDMRRLRHGISMDWLSADGHPQWFPPVVIPSALRTVSMSLHEIKTNSGRCSMRDTDRAAITHLVNAANKSVTDVERYINAQQNLLNELAALGKALQSLKSPWEYAASAPLAVAAAELHAAANEQLQQHTQPCSQQMQEIEDEQEQAHSMNSKKGTTTRTFPTSNMAVDADEEDATSESAEFDDTPRKAVRPSTPTIVWNPYTAGDSAAAGGRSRRDSRDTTSTTTEVASGPEEREEQSRQQDGEGRENSSFQHHEMQFSHEKRLQQSQLELKSLRLHFLAQIRQKGGISAARRKSSSGITVEPISVQWGAPCWRTSRACVQYIYIIMGSRSGRSELGGAKGAAAKSGPSSGEGALSATRGPRAQNKIRKKHDEEKTRSAMGPRGGQNGKLPLWAVAALKAGEEAKARAAAAAAARAALPPLPHVTLALIADVTHDQVTQQKNKQERQREKHSRGDSAPSGLSALEYLDLSCRGVQTAEDLSCLKGLCRVDLSSNSLTSLSFLAMNFSLAHLKAANNCIQSLGSSLENLSNLRVLDLSGNQLTRMEGFDSLPNLKALILSSNEISEAPESFAFPRPITFQAAAFEKGAAPCG
ncbi:leucine rich repeat-containing protein [Cyclospora cayetanensis]|uniref:Leucine rich repeat-containing protein n=1 Tax=Cyclospora cayetanensis TaxID=88456 RepID=A0A1D3DAU8_9EIME|nr:leucine rich repeat-containing protein [Cyclospora cayetanensis]